jgi:SAM-dependent methyltransferase
MQKVTDNYYQKNFWIQENTLYVAPNFRLKKCARLINRIAAGRHCDLLDVGCGPATLRTLLPDNMSYHGIDIALHHQAPYLVETDFAKEGISFRGKSFDFIIALGVFEYMGKFQMEKLEEIRSILEPGGTFIMSYINFGHCRKIVYPIYNNVQPIAQMKKSVGEVFRIDRCFPVSHHWRHKQPGRNSLPALQMHLEFNIPLVSPWLAVEYFFICSHPERST